LYLVVFQIFNAIKPQEVFKIVFRDILIKSVLAKRIAKKQNKNDKAKKNSELFSVF
jgi:hypothetical protein